MIMDEYLTKSIKNWTKKEKIPTAVIREAFADLENGKFRANLGGHLYKVDIQKGSRSKSAGYRSFIAYKKGNIAFMIYTIEKSNRGNITSGEKKELQDYGKALLNLNLKDLELMLKNKVIFKVF